MASAHLTDPEIAEYLALSSAKESSLATYESQLVSLRKRLGKPLSEVTIRDLGNLKRDLRRENQRSAPYYLRTLRGFYKSSGKNDLAVACRMPIKAPRLAPDAILTPLEVKQLIEASGSKRDAALIGAMWDTGGRISELLSLDLKDVREEKGAEPPRYVLWFHTVKSDGLQHEGYVLDTATTFRAWLKSHPFRDPSAPVFCSASRRRMGRKTAWAMMQAVARKAGITKHVHPHLFRHSRATALLRMRVPEVDVKKLLGWSPSSQQLTRYSHLTSRDSLLSLLVANGHSVPKEDEVGRVQVDDEKLVSVVPVPASPQPTLAFNVDLRSEEGKRLLEELVDKQARARMEEIINPMIAEYVAKLRKDLETSS